MERAQVGDSIKDFPGLHGVVVGSTQSVHNFRVL